MISSARLLRAIPMRHSSYIYLNYMAGDRYHRSPNGMLIQYVWTSFFLSLISILVTTSCLYLHCLILILLICNCLSSPGSCPGQNSVRGPSGLQYEINLVIIFLSTFTAVFWGQFMTRRERVARVMAGLVRLLTMLARSLNSLPAQQ